MMALKVSLSSPKRKTERKKRYLKKKEKNKKKRTPIIFSKLGARSYARRFAPCPSKNFFVPQKFFGIIFFKINFFFFKSLKFRGFLGGGAAAAPRQNLTDRRRPLLAADDFWLAHRLRFWEWNIASFDFHQSLVRPPSA